MAPLGATLITSAAPPQHCSSPGSPASCGPNAARVSCAGRTRAHRRLRCPPLPWRWKASPPGTALCSGKRQPLFPYLGTAFMLPRLLGGKASATGGMTAHPSTRPSAGAGAAQSSAPHQPSRPPRGRAASSAAFGAGCRSARVLPPALSNTAGDGRELEMPGEAFLILRSRII